MNRKKFYWLTIPTDEFDKCGKCKHQKINHGGSHKIIPYNGAEYIKSFGCIECEYEFGMNQMNITGAFYIRKSICPHFIPLEMIQIKYHEP